MIIIEKLDLVEFARDVYALSAPQGLGFLHAEPGGLAQEEARKIVARFDNDKETAL